MDVLIIETDGPIMRLISWALQGHGLQASTASDARDAAEQARGSQPRIIIFNTGMPEADKRACIDALRSVVPGVRVIDLLTTCDTANTGADAYVSAPLYPDRVIDVVDDELRRAS
jgi:DNA-binding response OmpR family regulator